MAAVKALKEEKIVNKSMSLISRTDHLMQLPVIMSKNTLRVVKGFTRNTTILLVKITM